MTGYTTHIVGRRVVDYPFEHLSMYILGGRDASNQRWRGLKARVLHPQWLEYMLGAVHTSRGCPETLRTSSPKISKLMSL
jgi:hypothetical protein